MKDARLFIGGERFASQMRVPVIGAYTRKDVAEAHVEDHYLVERAVDAAKRAFELLRDIDLGLLRHRPRVAIRGMTDERLSP